MNHEEQVRPGGAAAVVEHGWIADDYLGIYKAASKGLVGCPSTLSADVGSKSLPSEPSMQPLQPLDRQHQNIHHLLSYLLFVSTNRIILFT
jgi:hypothetical protein